MITTLTVHSFKSLAELEVELGQVNVFIGANGSGKSNILEAVGVLGAAVSGRVDDESLQRRGVRPGVPALYKTSFRGARVDPFIQFAAEWEAKQQRASYRVGMSNPIEAPRPAWLYRTEILTEEGHKVFGRSSRSKEQFNKEAGLAALRMVELAPESGAVAMLTALRDYVIYTPTTPTLRGLVSDPQQREPVGLSGGRLPEAVLQLLRAGYRTRHVTTRRDGTRVVRVKADRYYRQVRAEAAGLIDWADGFGAGPRSLGTLSPSVPSGRLTLRFWDRYMIEGRNVLTGHDASEGALYVLLAAVLGAHPGMPAFFAVDNFDHSLNPRLARALVERFCGWVRNAPRERQVLLTTHNPLVLDGLDLTNESIRLFAVDRTNTGRTVVERVVVDEKLLGRAKEGWTLSRLWVMGEIGGVPNV